jgi:hypothetical protein
MLSECEQLRKFRNILWDLMTGIRFLENVRFLVRFDVFTAVTMKNEVFWDVTPCALVIIDVSKELGASIIRVTRIDELGTIMNVSSRRSSVVSYC